jgi:hypothetical protein
MLDVSRVTLLLRRQLWHVLIALNMVLASDMSGLSIGNQTAHFCRGFVWCRPWIMIRFLLQDNVLAVAYNLECLEAPNISSECG